MGDIPKMAEREEAARLWQASRDADLAMMEAKNAAGCQDDFEEKMEALRAEMKLREDEIYGIVGLRKKADAAEAAVEAYCETAHSDWHEGELQVLRCAHSGVPLLLTDETVYDSDTGETFLRCALGLPPHPVDETEEELDDEAEAA